MPAAIAGLKLSGVAAVRSQGSSEWRTLGWVAVAEDDKRNAELQVGVRFEDAAANGFRR